MEQRESRLKRWFGKEHDPKRAAPVRQGIGYQLPSDGLIILGLGLSFSVHVLAGLPFMALGLFLFGMSIKTLVEALREPHWASPRGGGAAQPT
jgi:hypothetical protein